MTTENLKLALTAITSEASAMLTESTYGNESVWIHNVAQRIHTEVLGLDGQAQDAAYLMAIGAWHAPYWGFDNLAWLCDPEK